jgi:hypothetical protein
VTRHESEELLTMILDSGQEYRTVDEWHQLCLASQVREHRRRRMKARRAAALSGAFMVLVMAAAAVAGFQLVQMLVP